MVHPIDSTQPSTTHCIYGCTRIQYGEHPYLSILKIWVKCNAAPGHHKGYAALEGVGIDLVGNWQCLEQNSYIYCRWSGWGCLPARNADKIVLGVGVCFGAIHCISWGFSLLTHGVVDVASTVCCYNCCPHLYFFRVLFGWLAGKHGHCFYFGFTSCFHQEN